MKSVDESIRDIKKSVEKQVIREMFKRFWEDEIKQFAEEYIEEHSEDYFDGYTAVTGSSITEVFECHYEEFVDMYAEHIGEQL